MDLESSYNILKNTSKTSACLQKHISNFLHEEKPLKIPAPTVGFIAKYAEYFKTFHIKIN